MEGNSPEKSHDQAEVSQTPLKADIPVRAEAGGGLLKKILDKMRPKQKEGVVEAKSESLSSRLDGRLEQMQDWINKQMIRSESVEKPQGLRNPIRGIVEDMNKQPSELIRDDWSNFKKQFWDIASEALSVTNRMVISMRLRLGEPKLKTNEGKV